MKTYEMNLDDVPFEATKARRKIIEVRLNDERRENIIAGDLIEFSKKSNDERLKVVVTDVRKYNSMSDLSLSESFEMTGGIYLNKEDWKIAIDSYYSQEDQLKFGLVVFELRI